MQAKRLGTKCANYSVTVRNKIKARLSLDAGLHVRFNQRKMRLRWGANRESVMSIWPELAPAINAQRACEQWLKLTSRRGKWVGALPDGSWAFVDASALYEYSPVPASMAAMA